MKRFLLLLVGIQSFGVVAQSKAEEIAASREQHVRELSDTAHHVLKLEEIEHFGGLDYYDFTLAYQIQATFTKDIGKKFKMLTSTDRTPIYRRYGYLEFTVDGIPCKLEAYQNMAYRKHPVYGNQLFIPFKDKTATVTTYGGGRFMDIDIPLGDSVILDFNTAYNPYCAYSYRYSCPIPPKANWLDVEIKAGEKTPIGH